ncbi:uncharacterized protein LOC118191692 [Stegodyphus dumicola]|uniref:uncharacterized protein LOC118191692 n=1 Tax=Stegodyphus dumicola TaxID=202533 RepID=UPI0015A8E2D6|nr:uncharacterized protein LOC118191692 [Stegodyphus dumicola]
MKMDNISLEIGFITMEKNGVIIYSDDLFRYKNSYMLLYLKNRFLEFRFIGEKGTIILNSSKQIAIGKYHHVSLKCLLRYAVMYLDKKLVAMEPYRETFCSKFLLKKMIIGSLPRLSQSDAKHKFRIPDFSGCIYKLKIGTQEVNLRNLRGIALKDSQMMNKFTTNKILPTKMCLPLPIDSKNDSDPVSVIFSEEKALSTEVLEKTNTSFVLRTREHSKPIFSWIEHPSKDLQREIRISVQKGKTELWIYFGGNVRRIIRSSKPINDNKFHNVTLEKSMKELTLFVDDEKKTIKLKDRWPLDFKNGNFFFSVSRNRLHPDKSSTKNITDIFQGCIKEMQLNGISLKLVGFLPEQFLCDPS